MRLLRLEEGDKLTLTDDLTHDIPPYAILSHTWGRPGDEVKLQDIRDKEYRQKPGYRKILFCGEQAQRDGLEHFWVDTCCIDKTSSAELTEAINSMYRWYQNAEKCYVYLPDVSTSCDVDSRSFRSSWLRELQDSKWFTRGWTLQELIAPPVVEFYSSNGQKLGDKTSLEETIHDITRIPILVLRGNWQSEVQLHTRISWLYNRETTRQEDKAYSLLGLVGVSMPVIYGEGEEEAFIRLCREVILRYYSDHNLFTLVARFGRVATICVLLDRGADIDSQDNEGYSPLARAASGGHAAAVRLLLDKGANIESKDTDGRCPLAMAASKGREAVARLLLDKGAIIESKDNKGVCVLAYAASKGHEAVVRLLLDKGANIESKDNAGARPLAYAAMGGHEAVVRLLLDKGANVDKKDNRGSSPLARAASNGHEAVVRVLREKEAKIEPKHNDTYSPLARSVLKGYEKVVRLVQR